MMPVIANISIDDTTDILSLARKVADGDDVAAHRFLQLALPRVRKSAGYLCTDITEKEDVIQNTLVELVKSAGSFQGNCRFSYWVDRITVHMASRIIGKKIRRRRIQNETWFPATVPRSVEEELDYKKMQEQLAQIFNSIRLPERTPLILHHLYGYSVEEIADMTDAGIHTVRSRLRNGMKKMRKFVLHNEVLSDWILVKV